MADENWDDNAVSVQAYPLNSGGSQWNSGSSQWNSGRNYNDNNWSNFDNPNNVRSQEFTRGGGGRGRRSDRGGGNTRGNWRNQENEETEIIKIPSKYVGRVIGRGGSKISELQTESGARIHVTKELEGSNTIVKLFGDENSVAKAKELIDELTVDTVRTEYKAEEKIEPKAQTQPEFIDWQQVLKHSEEAAKAEWEKLPPIKKDFYIPHPEVMKMSQQEVEIFREENNNIVVNRTIASEKSRPIPKPCTKFYHAFHQYPEILEEIRKAGFEKPSPIQAQAWPVLLSGQDLIGIAQTGTGKTLAFLLPAMIHIDGQPNRTDRGGPAVLVMAPTRELALQIDKEVKKYQYKGITSVCIYGGGNRREQVKVVTEGVDIVIATPGRLNDLIDAGHLNVKTVTYAVLDEADRMLDMGFEPQIRKIMYGIRPTRQTVMTSATWPVGVRRLVDSYMVDPVQVYVGTLDLAATHTVTQVIQMMSDDESEKMETLKDFICNLGPDQKVIIFCGRKARADELATELVLGGVNCQTIHGDRDQIDREQALADISDGTVQILIATDVASRGLDIDDITHVLNFDFPRNIEEYVHRVGRTGRAGKLGESISYFTRADWAQAEELIKILEEAQQYVPEELYQMAERYKAWNEKKMREGGGRGRGRGGGRRW